MLSKSASSSRSYRLKSLEVLSPFDFKIVFQEGEDVLIDFESD